MTLEELTSSMAEILGLPKAELVAIANALDDGELLGQRGLDGELRVAASSLTNLLLGSMARCSPTEVAETVSRLREAVTDPSKENSKGEARPILDHPIFSQRHLLGDALDTIVLSYAAEDGFDDEGYGLPITNMSLSVAAPQTLNYSAELWLDNGDDDWTLSYHRNHPAFDGAADSMKVEIAKRLMVGRGDMSSTSSVSSTTFYELGDTLSRTVSSSADEQLVGVLGKKPEG